MLKQKHQQLSDLLQAELLHGKWQNGERLPNLRDLATQYSVSVSVASQAIALLKQQKLVKVVVGDGIYSTCNGSCKKKLDKFSGGRLFGTYARAKILHILLEDHSDSQWKFWSDFFRDFADDNSDIELEICRLYAPEKTQDYSFDMALGGVPFLLQHHFSPDQIVDTQTLSCFGIEYFPHFQIAASQKKNLDTGYFPYATVSSKLYSDQKIPAVLPGENCLEYAERFARDFNGVYTMLRGLGFLEGCGVSFLSNDGSSFCMPSRILMLDVFKRMRVLYQAEHLVWFHGKSSNFESLWPYDGKNSQMIAEIPSNAVYFKHKNFESIPVPEGRVVHATMMCAAIHKDCLFPEECVRIIRALLGKDVQKALHNSFSVTPILPELSSQLNILPQAGSFENVPSFVLHEALYQIVEWELMHYLNKKREDEVYDLICSKMNYYLQHFKDFK